MTSDKDSTMVLLTIILIYLQVLSAWADDFFRPDTQNSGFMFIPYLVKETHDNYVDCLGLCELEPKCNVVTFDKTRRMCRGYDNITQSEAFISVPGTNVWTNSRQTTRRYAYPGKTWIADTTRVGKVYSPTNWRQFIPQLDDCVVQCRTHPDGCHYLTFTEHLMDCRGFIGAANSEVALENTTVWMPSQYGRDLESPDSFYLIVKENLNRAAAQAYCEQDGIFGKLLKINNAEEQTFLDNNAAFDGATTGTLWMDAEANAEGRFLWNGKRPEFSYMNYAYDEPQDTLNKKCLTMSKTTGKWASADCAALMHFVCELDRLWEE